MSPKTLSWQKKHVIKTVINALSSDEIVISSTDTIFGFLGNLTMKSFQKIVALKQDRQDKPFLILIKSPAHLDYFTPYDDIDSSLKNLINHAWPGPLTIIFKARHNLPSFCVSSKGTVALRCPDHAGLQKVLEHFKGLFSTSANKAGKPIPQKSTDIDPDLFAHVAYFINKSGDKQDKALPSTILDCSTPEKIVLIRKGQYTLNKLETWYGKRIDTKEI